ncbi:MAG: SPOR domain-containing protein [Acidobacteria bacterium]|nr:SPOR domain-containing protein [Acidobacteriota bacterium]
MLATIVLTRKTTTILLVGSTLVMGSMFLAGLVVGLALWKPTQQDILLAKAYRQSQPVGTGASRKEVPPAAPIVQPEAAQPARLERAPAPVAASPAPVPAAADKASPVAAANASPAAAPTAPPQQAAAEVKPSAPPVVRGEEGEYTLQLGSFREPKNAQQLVAELKERNIQARIFKAPDADLRMWYAVRVSLFPDLSSASRAAADFTNREQIQALVRRTRSL